MLFSQATHLTTATAAAVTTAATTKTQTATTIAGTSPATTTTTSKASHAKTTTKLAATIKIQAVHQGWQCPNCTLVNDDTRPGCAACATERPQAEGAAAKDEPEVRLGKVRFGTVLYCQDRLGKDSLG